MRKRAHSTGQSEDGALGGTPIPSEIAQYIKGRTVHVAEPERYFAKHWRLRLPCAKQGIKEIKPNFFRLEHALFADFISTLQRLLEAKNDVDSTFAASDWIPYALWGTCAPNVPSGQGFVHEWSVTEPSGQSSAAGGGTTPSPGQPASRSVQIELELGVDVYESDWRLDIRFIGAPLEIIELATHEGHGHLSRRSAQKQARRLWRLLAREIELDLGLGDQNRGRPLSQAGQLAAFLHCHFGLSWSRVARRLCQEQHTHNSSCKENYRKLASQYWERERKNVRRSAVDAAEPIKDS